MAGRHVSSDDLAAPFIFVSKGGPEPTEWLRAHPGAVRFPATMVPRALGNKDRTNQPPRLSSVVPNRPSAPQVPAAPDFAASQPPPAAQPRGKHRRQRSRHPPASDPDVADASGYWQRLDEARALVNAGREATPADTEIVAEHLAKSLTKNELEHIRRDGIGFLVTEVEIGHEDREFYKMGARGYIHGETLGNRPGTYIEKSQQVLIATQAGSHHQRRLPEIKESTSADVLLHELGHGINRQEGEHGAYLSDSPEFKAAYKADANHGYLATSYFHQKSSGSVPDTAKDETFAESFAEYNRDPDGFRREYPNLFNYFSDRFGS